MPGPGESGRNGSIAVAQALQYCVFSLPVTIHAKRASARSRELASLSGRPKLPSRVQISLAGRGCVKKQICQLVRIVEFTFTLNLGDEVSVVGEKAP
jgi:hypothetical protein